MSTQKTPPTHDEKIANATKNLMVAIENKSKAEGKTPEYTFGIKVADGVKKSFESGAIPSEQDIKDDALTLAGAKQSLTSGALVAKATKIMSLACYLSKIDGEKAKLKRENKDISNEELENKIRPYIESLDKDLKAKADATAQAKMSKKTESTS